MLQIILCTSRRFSNIVSVNCSSRYVDVILNLIRIAGDYVSEEVWYRVIQIVINRDEVQGYAAKTVFEVR